MKNKEPLLITLNNYPESCNLCRIGLITDYTDLYKWKVLNHFFVGYVESGSLRWEFKNKIVNMKKGDIFICYPGVISRAEELEPDTQIYSIEFTKEFLDYHYSKKNFPTEVGKFFFITYYLNNSANAFSRRSLSSGLIKQNRT